MLNGERGNPWKDTPETRRAWARKMTADRTRAWHQQPGFLKLRWEWYKKLRKSGFVDMENHRRVDGEAFERLNGVSRADIFKTYSPDKERYHQLAEHFLGEMRDGTEPIPGPPKRRKTMLKVWEQHAMHGDGMTRISRALRLRPQDCDTLLKAGKEAFLAWVRRQEDALSAELAEEDSQDA